jgi:hypothetical protein
MAGQKRHTTLNLDLALIREAAEVMGTEGITATVHGALRAVVNRHKIEQLLDYDFPGLTLESLEQVRSLRVPGPVEDLQPA